VSVVRGLGSSAVVLLAMAALFAPSDADACQYIPNLSSAVPTGAEHPVNAAVILVGALRPELVTATIDGAPVAIVLDPELTMEDEIFDGMYLILALRFEPAPVAGQTVAVDGVPCEDGPEFCPPFHVEYVAVDPDATIADGEGNVEFDLIRFATPLWGQQCNEGGSVIRARPDLDPEVFADEAFALLEVRAFHDEAGLEDVIRMPLDAYSLDTVHVFDETILGPAFPLEGWCVELTVRDAAGNADVLGTGCEACMYADEEGHEWDPPLQPIPGGPCDDGSASTTSTGGSTDTSGGDESTTDIDTPLPDPSSDSGPTTDDPSAPPTHEDDTGGPALDDVADRGCACTSSTASPGLPLLCVVPLLRRRKTRASRHARAGHRRPTVA